LVSSAVTGADAFGSGSVISISCIGYLALGGLALTLFLGLFYEYVRKDRD
jgi:hypothetical protein